MKNYPDYPAHWMARCFNCGGEFDGDDIQGNNEPTGRWSQPCRRCRMRTFYDLVTTIAASMEKPDADRI